MSLPIILYYVVQWSQLEEKITCIAVEHSNSITMTLNGILISQYLSGVGTGNKFSCIAMVTGSLGPFPGGLDKDLDFVPVHEAKKN